MVKNNKLSFQIITLGVILLIAAFLRLYRISQLTEFLGDQGRTGIHIFQAWKNKTLPLVGPTVLSGQYLGPAYYYLIAPAFILSGFNTVAPAVFTALLGVGAVGLLWVLGCELFGWEVATMLSVLWAVSPQIVSSDRVLWEPNIIPFFVFLYLLSYIKKWYIVVGISLGILVQLHYPNFLFIALSVFFGLRSGIVVGFLLSLSPFLFYESQHGFTDVIGVLTNFSSGGEYRFFANLIDYSGRVMHRLAQLPGTFFLLFLPIFFKLTFWKKFVGLWFIVGLAAMSFYRGIVFDHYLFFLFPAAYLMFGFLLAKLNKEYAIVIVLILVVLHLSKSDIFKPGVNDIARVRIISQEIIKTADREAFSFGLIASRSYSDLHYRYFFLINKESPEPIISESYKNLFLVCEADKCPELIESVQILCYDPHCKGEYPRVDLNSWKLISMSDIQGARLYHYQRESVK